MREQIGPLLNRWAADLKETAMRWHVWRRRGRNAPFASVAVETSAHCHRRCSYCPVAQAPKAKKIMELALFERIVGELAGIGFDGRFCYHFYNEPLLVRTLEDYVRIASRALPRARHVIYTSGDHLTEARVTSLLEAGLDGFVVTDHGGRAPPPPVKTARGWAGHPAIRYRKLRPQRALFTRGGLVQVANPRTPRRCPYPAYELIIGISGDVLLCCNDYFGANSFGNVAQTPILEIWNSTRMRRIRQGLMEGRFELPICQVCSGRAAE